MFGYKKDYNKVDYKAKYESEKTERLYAERKRIEDKSDHEIYVKQIKADHEIELKKKQAEIDLFESFTIKTLENEITDLQIKLAVAETKLEFMSKITDVNADVLDVKELVNKLIEKMPTVNINSIIAGLSGATKTEVKE
jgi:hypothetical protein